MFYGESQRWLPKGGWKLIDASVIMAHLSLQVIAVITAYYITPVLLITMLCCGFLMSKANCLPHLSESPSGDRAGFLDGVRGLAAMVVVCSHAWRSTWFDFEIPKVGVKYWFDQNLGAIGVQVFFCITAFLFVGRILKTDGNMDFYKFFESRFKRIVPLYLVWACITLFVIVFFGDWSKLGFYSVPEAAKIFWFGFYGNNIAIAGFKYPVMTSVIWTLALEIKFYLFIPVLAVIYRRKNIFFSSVVVLFFMFFALFWTQEENPIIFFFIGGVGAFLYRLPVLRSKSIALIFYSVMLCCVYCLVFLEYQRYGLLNFVLMCGVFLPLVVLRPKVLEVKPLVFIGEVSYSIYLVHLTLFYVYAKFVSFFVSPYLDGAFWFFVMLSLYGCFVVFVSFLTFKYVEYPYIRKSTSKEVVGSAQRNLSEA